MVVQIAIAQVAKIDQSNALFRATPNLLTNTLLVSVRCDQLEYVTCVHLFHEVFVWVANGGGHLTIVL